MNDDIAPDNRLAADIRVADATKKNWVDRFMPLWTRPYLRLSRADRPAGTWLLLLPGLYSLALAIAATGWRVEDVWFFTAFCVGAFLMRGAGCTWNDLADHEFDAEVARTRSRPLPSGAVSRTGAKLWMLAQALLAFFILITFNNLSILLGVLSLGLVAIYPFMKRVTWWPQVFLGLAFNWGALMAWTVHTGELSVAAGLLYLGGIAWTLHYDTIYAHQDKDDDALIGLKSTARLFDEATVPILAGFSAVAVICAAVAAAITLSGLKLTIALIAVAAYAVHLAWQLVRLDINNGDVCLKLFRENRDTGLILLGGFLLASLV